MYKPQTLSEAIGTKIKSRRKSLRMTQKELSKSIGISFQQVQKYENGSSSLSLQIFLKLCSILNVHPDYFFENFSLKENSFESTEENLEQELLKFFRNLSNEKVKKRIVNLLKALALDLEE